MDLNWTAFFAVLGAFAVCFGLPILIYEVSHRRQARRRALERDNGC